MQDRPTTRSQGVRLPVWMWAAVERDATAMGMSTNEVLRRRLDIVYAPPAREHKEARGA